MQKKGARFSNQFFSLKFHLNKERFCRYSVVVSKKIAALAVQRNLLKRQLYEIIRTMGDMPAHLDYVITLKAPLVPLSFADKKLKILEALKIASQNTPTHG